MQNEEARGIAACEILPKAERECFPAGWECTLTEGSFFSVYYRKTEEEFTMGFVAMIGPIFGPLVSLLFAAWFYVRWQNEGGREAGAEN